MARTNVWLVKLSGLGFAGHKDNTCSCDSDTSHVSGIQFLDGGIKGVRMGRPRQGRLSCLHLVWFGLEARAFGSCVRNRRRDRMTHAVRFGDQKSKDFFGKRETCFFLESSLAALVFLEAVWA